MSRETQPTKRLLIFFSELLTNLLSENWIWCTEDGAFEKMLKNVGCLITLLITETTSCLLRELHYTLHSGVG